MTLLFLFTVSDILQNVLISLTTSLMCKYPNNVYTVSIKKGIQLMNNPLLFQIYVASVGRPLLSAFVLQWRIKYASVRVPLFFYVCAHQTLLHLSSPIWSIAWPSFHLYIRIFQHAEMPTWNLEPQGQTEQRAELLSAFTAEGNLSALFYFPFEFTESIPIHVSKCAHGTKVSQM